MRIAKTFGISLVLLLTMCTPDSDDPATPSGGGSAADTSTTGEIFDIDGNIYPTRKIGTQWWMALDLKTTRYRNGTPIPNITGDSAWSTLYTAAWCNYENDIDNNLFGKFYNGYAAKNAFICPYGWHVPTEAEWNILQVFLGQNAGGKLKKAGFGSIWDPPNTGATNETGFTGLPNGFREDFFGGFSQRYKFGFWWSRNGTSLNKATLRYDNSELSLDNYQNIRAGQCIRCLQD